MNSRTRSPGWRSLRGRGQGSQGGCYVKKAADKAPEGRGKGQLKGKEERTVLSFAGGLNGSENAWPSAREARPRSPSTLWRQRNLPMGQVQLPIPGHHTGSRCLTRPSTILRTRAGGRRLTPLFISPFPAQNLCPWPMDDLRPRIQ